MGNKMLIDAAHPEETRVVVLRGNRIEEFDFEAASKRQLRGNIYLAKVTRVEPSLQAAFIEYGGNRHGFLAFAEIHPDYYQIPVADRQALIEEEARSHDDENEDEARPSSHGSSNGGRRSRRHRRSGGGGGAEKRAARADTVVSSEAVTDANGPDGEILVADFAAAEGGMAADPDLSPEMVDAPTDQADAAPAMDEGDDVPPGGEDETILAASPAHDAPDHAADDDHAEEMDGEDGSAAVTTLEHGGEETHTPQPTSDDAGHDDHGREDDGHEEDVVEQLGGDALEDVPHRVSRPRRNYKIQEVIKRRQVLLVQVVKEERGNKGAALTTYLSLAGRYSVLMPNTARGGGISRKITDAEDRKRLKAIAQELEVPDGMGIILRTAGAARGMPEVKRDFEYLMRMWETVRETTLKSSAPFLVYEEGSLIKRSIRDLFNKDVDEVIVAGEDAYREAREFMRLLMPGQTKNVIPYRDPQPIFAKAGAEAQLDAMFSNQVVLKSGGYLVINQTEALVAIDVNSGRSTREHNIEDTALRTNLEAADEVARQLRLRDLAGLIVVDFIDMEESRNDRAVERRIKDALKNDRARIQIGRISHFGLLEMSRQRMRTGVLEGSTVMCPHCAGSGTVRSISSIALHVLRMIEDALIKSATYNLIARTRSEVALYILNQKRVNLLDLESRFGVAITVFADPAMTGAVYHAIERGGEATPPHFLSFQSNGARSEAAIQAEDEDLDALAVDDLDEEDVEEEAEDHQAEDRPAAREQVARQPNRAPGESESEGEGGRRRKRRRRRRGRDGQGPGTAQSMQAEDEAQPSDAGLEQVALSDSEPDGGDLTDIESGFVPAHLEPEAEPDQEPVAGEVMRAMVVADPLEENAGGTLSSVPAGEPDIALPDQPETAPVVDAAVEPAAVPDAVEAPRRRRSRRVARATDAEAEAEPVDTPAGEAVEAATPARRPRRARSRPAEVKLDGEATTPSSDVSPELPLMAIADAEAAPPPSAGPGEAEQASPVTSDHAEDAPEQGEPDSDRPKRSGWWQRAKATFTTGS